MTEHQVLTANPLTVPYRTGSYLISDQGPDNFRSAMTLPDHPYRASGSHQLGVADFARVLNPVISTYQPSVLFLVDLREESHVYFDGNPFSWYADNDFGNVGMSKEAIRDDERAKAKNSRGRNVKVFTITDDTADDLQQERVLPVSYTELTVHSAQTEAKAAKVLGDVFSGTKIQYVRIPVTDHCAPSAYALARLQDLTTHGGWVHFHCHGGDGRTSTFLALYDMLCWKQSGDPLPALEEFADRQCQLFDYCLNPSGCTCSKPTKAWELSLAQERWRVLGEFLNELEAAGNGRSVE